MSIVTARSEPLSSTVQLEEVAQKFQQVFAHQDFRRFVPGDDRFVTLPWDLCLPLDALNVDTLTVNCALDAGATDALEDFRELITRYGPHTKRMALLWDILYEAPRTSRTDFELWLEAGWREIPELKQGYFFSGVHVGGLSPGMRDLNHRAGLLRRIIAALGVDQAFQVRMEGGTLYVVSRQPGWRLQFTCAEEGGANPGTVFFCGFRTGDACVADTVQAVAQMARKVCQLNFSATMLPDAYQQMRGALNKASGGWTIEAYGSMKPEAYTCVWSAGPSQFRRVPVFCWRVKLPRDGEHTYHADCVRHSLGWCLEVSSNCGDDQKLLEALRGVGSTAFSSSVRASANLHYTLTCPVCGYMEVTESYSPCEICAWDYCPMQSEEPDDGGAPNYMTLRQAQKNFQRFGAISEKYLELTRKPTASDVQDANWTPLDPMP